MPEDKLQEPSEEFKRAIVHASSAVIECTFCGRVYFSKSELGAYEEGQLEELIEQSKKEPNKYIECEDWIEWGNLAGHQCVVDCKCNQARKYEDVFWAERHIISDYFKARAKKQQEHAERDSKLAKEVSEAVDSTTQ